MYLFAHLFTGTLIGLMSNGFRGNVRLLAACVAGSLFPDLLDKPLALLVPGIFGSTRTLGHTLLSASVLIIAGMVLLHRYRNPLIAVFAGMTLLHQILDMIWTLPVTWFFPLFGMFETLPVRGGFFQFMITELANPSEWVFAIVSLFFLLSWYPFGSTGAWLPRFPGGNSHILYCCMAGVLLITGIWLTLGGPVPFLAFTGLAGGLDKTIVAGLIAGCGAVCVMHAVRIRTDAGKSHP